MMIMLLLSLLLFAIFFKATAEVTHTHTQKWGEKAPLFFLIFVRSCGKLNNGRKVEEREEKKNAARETVEYKQ